jgi:hypothetical protein
MIGLKQIKPLIVPLTPRNSVLCSCSEMGALILLQLSFTFVLDLFFLSSTVEELVLSVEYVVMLCPGLADSLSAELA